MHKPNKIALALAALPLFAMAACNYQELTPGVYVTVTNIPASANHIEATLTDSAGAHDVHPHFGLGANPNASLDLAFLPPAPGNFSVAIHALDNQQTPVGDATVPQTPYTGTTLFLTTAIVPEGTNGNYGAPCATGVPAGSPNTCNGSLVCKAYGVTDQGICTISCVGSGSGPGDCPVGISPAPTCKPFLGGASFCQWPCDTPVDGGPLCPTGLVCRSNGSGGSFCQGS